MTQPFSSIHHRARVLRPSGDQDGHRWDSRSRGDIPRADTAHEVRAPCGQGLPSAREDSDAPWQVATAVSPDRVELGGGDSRSLVDATQHELITVRIGKHAQSDIPMAVGKVSGPSTIDPPRFRISEHAATGS